MIEVDKYTKIQVEEYNGTFSIQEVYVNKEGEVVPQWILRKYGKDKGWLDRPLKIPIGTRDTAKENLIAVYKEIYGDADVPF